MTDAVKMLLSDASGFATARSIASGIRPQYTKMAASIQK